MDEKSARAILEMGRELSYKVKKLGWRQAVIEKARLCGWNGCHVAEHVIVFRGSIHSCDASMDSEDLKAWLGLGHNVEDVERHYEGYAINSRVRVEKLSDGMFEVTYPGLDENTRVVPEHKLLETVRGAILEGYVPDPVPEPEPVPVVGALRTFVVTPAGQLHVERKLSAFNEVEAAIQYTKEGMGLGFYNVREVGASFASHVEVVEAVSYTPGREVVCVFGRSLGRILDPVKVAA